MFAEMMDAQSSADSENIYESEKPNYAELFKVDETAIIYPEESPYDEEITDYEEAEGTPTAEPKQVEEVISEETPTAEPKQAEKVISEETPAAEPKQAEEVISEETPAAEPKQAEEVISEETQAAEPEQTDAESLDVTDENEETISELDAVKNSIDALREELSEALAALRRKNADIALVDSKLDAYKKTAEDKLVNIFFLDIISIIDNIKRMSALYRENKDHPGLLPCDTFESYAMDLENILLNNEVEIISTKVGEKFNPRNQRIIKKIPTDDKELHGIIETIFSDGYVLNGRVISPAKVAAYFYTQPKG